MACKHKRLTFKPRFAQPHGGRMLELTGHCGDCGAPVLFEPKPTLSLDDRTFQIPVRLGAPNLANLQPNRLAEVPIVLGGPRKAAH